MGMDRDDIFESLVYKYLSCNIIDAMWWMVYVMSVCHGYRCHLWVNAAYTNACHAISYTQYHRCDVINGVSDIRSQIGDIRMSRTQMIWVNASYTDTCHAISYTQYHRCDVTDGVSDIRNQIGDIRISRHTDMKRWQVTSGHTYTCHMMPYHAIWCNIIPLHL